MKDIQLIKSKMFWEFGKNPRIERYEINGFVKYLVYYTRREDSPYKEVKIFNQGEKISIWEQNNFECLIRE